MIEKIVLDHLQDLLGFPVYMEVPENVPDYFVVVMKNNSDRVNLLKYAMITAYSYAPTLYQAAELNEIVKEAMDNLIDCNEVTASKLNTDGYYPDTTDKRYRYQAVYDVNYY